MENASNKAMSGKPKRTRKTTKKPVRKYLITGDDGIARAYWGQNPKDALEKKCIELDDYYDHLT